MSGALASPALQLWGGIECTVNRVGDRYFDQLARCGHVDRAADIDVIADLGIRVLRYPVLWERTAPDGVDRAGWAWPDERLTRLRERGVEPIVGLMHHGSGPRTTSLVDPGFADALAAYAAAVARRYPWVRRWTPVNEPLTTARFCGLYGLWHPHGRDDRVFARALINQCAGIVRAMRAIRREIPDALLVQTEDLGRTYGTPGLRYQVEFENERRWLTYDLLCGRVDRTHPMWEFLCQAGISAGELEQIRDEVHPPEVIGVNHYVTSERWLDERLERFPPATHGGNGRHFYADVEAVRVLPDGPGGPIGVIGEAWRRYAVPIVITEAHLGGHREQQLRWLHEIWQAALTLRASGADIRAVTAWSLFGAFDWHNLVTRDEGRYEPGAFDVRASRPRFTAVGRMVRDLATSGSHGHPVLATAGWWRGDGRLFDPATAPRRNAQACAEPPLLVTGGAGTLGRAFARICAERGLTHHAVSRRELDIAHPPSVARVLDTVRPWAVVNAAGYVRVDDAELDGDACERNNLLGPAVLADACERRGIALLTFSTDLVFDGACRDPYLESAAPSPLGQYGRSKALAEHRVLARMPDALIVRTSAFFGPWDPHNFIAVALRAMRDGHAVQAAEDQVVSPTYVPDLVDAALDILIDGERGIWHLANAGAITWAAFARAAADRAGLDPALVVARSSEGMGQLARRPAYSVLGSERGLLLPGLDDALSRCLAAQEAPAMMADPQTIQ